RAEVPAARRAPGRRRARGGARRGERALHAPLRTLRRPPAAGDGRASRAEPAGRRAAARDAGEPGPLSPARTRGRRRRRVLAGDGAARPQLEELARARALAARVRFLGATDRPTTLALLRSAVAVACPSRFEGLPLVCLEALAAGRPVVATAVNGIPEVIREGETGFLVPPEDPAALAAALARVVAAPDA